MGLAAKLWGALLRPDLVALRLRLRRHLRGTGASIIASNYVGSRLSLLAREPFNSPTVDLWMPPDDYLTFVERLEDYRALGPAFQPIPEETEALGYPVAALRGEERPEIRVWAPIPVALLFGSLGLAPGDDAQASRAIQAGA